MHIKKKFSLELQAITTCFIGKYEKTLSMMFPSQDIKAYFDFLHIYTDFLTKSLEESQLWDQIQEVPKHKPHGDNDAGTST